MRAHGVCATGEWYHCYNRGVDKRVVFEDDADYQRFLLLLYVANGTKTVRPSDARCPSLEEFLKPESLNRGERLVEIAAYALMPNHVHIALKQTRDDGIARFMQKVFTGYTMYFNLKRGRTGALFAGTYKSKHIAADEYFKHLLSYIMLNPVELFEHQWKKGVGDLEQIRLALLSYPYSSAPDFFDVKRPERKMMDTGFSNYYDRKPHIEDMLTEAQAYYREHCPEV